MGAKPKTIKKSIPKQIPVR